MTTPRELTNQRSKRWREREERVSKTTVLFPGALGQERVKKS